MKSLWIVGTLLVFGCASVQEWQPSVIAKVQRTAAKDFTCNADEIQVTRVDDATFDVEGCSMAGRYSAQTEKGLPCKFNRANAVERHCLVQRAPESSP